MHNLTIEDCFRNLIKYVLHALITNDRNRNSILMHKMPVILIKNLVDRLVISFRREGCDISLRLNEFRKGPNYVTIKNAIHLLCVKKLRQDA